MGRCFLTPADEWARCREWIKAATLHGPGFEDIATIEAKLASGIYSLWPGRNCAAIAEIRTYAKKRALAVIAGGGDMAELLKEIEPALCRYAKAMGCNMILGEGRKGWERTTKANGYRLGFITMVKDI